MSEKSGKLNQRTKNIITEGVGESARHVDQAKIGALVRRIGEFYNVPQSSIDKGLKAEILVLDKEEFFREYESFMLKGMVDAKELRKKMPGNTQEVLRKICAELGMNVDALNACVELDVDDYFPDSDRCGGVVVRSNPPKVIMRENDFLGIDDIQIHELFHIMGMNKGDKFSGFRSDGIDSIDHRNMDEATVEILRLHMKYPDQSTRGLIEKIVSDEIKSPYLAQVGGMLLTMSATIRPDKPPFTFDDLAKYYFNENGHDGALLASEDILSRVIDENWELVDNFLVHDFNPEVIIQESKKITEVASTKIELS